MESRWIYTGCDTEDERVLFRQWQRMQAGVESVLESLTEAPDDFVIAVGQDAENSPDWTVQAVVTLPTNVCVVEARGDAPQLVLQQCVRRLTTRLEMLEPDVPEPRQRRHGLNSLIPLLQQSRKEERMHTFAGFLRPLLSSLQGHAARELEIYEMEEDLPTGQWEVDELLDETLLLAWSHFPDRPSSVPLDAWLTGLLGQVLERIANQEEPHVSLNRVETATSERPLDEELSTDRWIEQVNPADEIELSDLIPGEPPLMAWEQIDAAHRDAGLNLLLGKLTREQRQALLLSAVYGLDTAEIAAIQHISAKEVTDRVTSARNQFMHFLDQEDLWPQVQEFIERREHAGHRQR